VVTANLLAEPLKAGSLCLRDLAEVQRRREWPTRVIQALGAVVLGQLQPDVRKPRPRSSRILTTAPNVFWRWRSGICAQAYAHALVAPTRRPVRQMSVCMGPFWRSP
jgi:hypothetical protein